MAILRQQQPVVRLRAMDVLLAVRQPMSGQIGFGTRAVRCVWRDERLSGVRSNPALSFRARET
jgi:hypothetical protein